MVIKSLNFSFPEKLFTVLFEGHIGYIWNYALVGFFLQYFKYASLLCLSLYHSLEVYCNPYPCSSIDKTSLYRWNCVPQKDVLKREPLVGVNGNLIVKSFFAYVS